MFLVKHHTVLVVVILVLLTACSSRETPKNREIENVKYSESELYNELIRRAAKKNKTVLQDTLPINKGLSKFNSQTVYEMLRVIYGEDNRRNFYESDITPEERTDAEKVGCLVKKNQLKKNSDGTYSLISQKTYGEKYKLCADEKFAREPVISFCSGFAVSPKLFVTAGHCLNVSDLANTVIVYGYKMLLNGEANLVISPNDVYELHNIRGREYQGSGNDYAVIEIKGSFIPSRIASVRQTGQIPDNTNLHVIGYPCGLPVKIASGSSVFNNSMSGYFVINSDTYRGNSGSPVFNSKTHQVEGILVRGEDDFNFIELTSCFRSARCPKDIGKCRGEDVSRISQFQHLIK